MKSEVCGRLGRAVTFFPGGYASRLKCGKPAGHSGPHECHCGCGRTWWKMRTKRKTAPKGAERK